jgi:hypothetical protein
VTDASRAVERGVAARRLCVERYAFRETTDLEALDLEHVSAVSTGGITRGGAAAAPWHARRDP